MLLAVPIFRYDIGPGEASGMPLGLSGPLACRGQDGVESRVDSKERDTLAA